MTAGIIALALTAVGIGLIVVGVVVSLADRKRSLEEKGEVKAEGTTGETLEGLAKLAEALRDYPLGMQLIFVGVALLLAGGATGGVAAIATA
jgi:uncharacterized membrane protein